MEQSSLELLSNCPACSSARFTPIISSMDFFLTNEKFIIVRCMDCGFMFTNPRPFENESKRYYKSSQYISHTNSSQSAIEKLYQLARRITINSKVRFVKRFIPGGNVLDIGCGTGEFLYALKQKGFKVEGVEPDEPARTSAVQKYNLRVADKFTPNFFPGGSFQAVTLWHVLEHIYPLTETIVGIKQVLSKDGILVIALPNPHSLDAKIYKEFWAAYDLPRHIYHFAPETAIQFFENHGFNLIRKSPMYFDSFYVSLLSEKYKTGSLNYMQGFFNGARSNLHAKIKGNNYSSLTYTLELKIK